MPNPNIARVSPIWLGLACSWRSSSGREIWRRPVASVEKDIAATRPPLRLRIRDSLMVAYHRSHPGAMKEGGHTRATDGANPQALAVLMDVEAAGRAETESL